MDWELALALAVKGWVGEEGQALFIALPCPCEMSGYMLPGLMGLAKKGAKLLGG